MTITLAVFGIARDIIGAATLPLDIPAEESVDELLARLRRLYPALAELRSLAIAVNSEYAHPADRLHPHDEVALLPPVSGG